LNNDDDEMRIKVCEQCRYHWEAIRPQVATWIKTNYARWEEEQPAWWNERLKYNIDDDLLPETVLAAFKDVSRKERGSLIDHLKVKSERSERSGRRVNLIRARTDASGSASQFAEGEGSGKRKSAASRKKSRDREASGRSNRINPVAGGIDKVPSALALSAAGKVNGSVEAEKGADEDTKQAVTRSARGTREARGTRGARGTNGVRRDGNTAPSVGAVGHLVGDAVVDTLKAMDLIRILGENGHQESKRRIGGRATSNKKIIGGAW
jgi:hypothetical protein